MILYPYLLLYYTLHPVPRKFLFSGQCERLSRRLLITKNCVKLLKNETYLVWSVSNLTRTLILFCYHVNKSIAINIKPQLSIQADAVKITVININFKIPANSFPVPYVTSACHFDKVTSLTRVLTVVHPIDVNNRKIVIHPSAELNVTISA